MMDPNFGVNYPSRPPSRSSTVSSSLPTTPRHRQYQKASGSTPDPRLCPRVMVHAKIPKGCALASPKFDKDKLVSEYLRHRSPDLTPLDIEMMIMAKKSIQEIVNGGDREEEVEGGGGGGGGSGSGQILNLTGNGNRNNVNNNDNNSTIIGTGYNIISESAASGYSSDGSSIWYTNFNINDPRRIRTNGNLASLSSSSRDGDRLFSPPRTNGLSENSDYEQIFPADDQEITSINYNKHGDGFNLKQPQTQTQTQTQTASSGHNHHHHHHHHRRYHHENHQLWHQSTSQHDIPHHQQQKTATHNKHQQHLNHHRPVRRSSLLLDTLNQLRSDSEAFESSDDGCSRSNTSHKGRNVPKQQLTAYVAWVNSQLKKKPGAHLVEDLRHDIRDGVALVDLVEVIGGEVLEGVHPAPSTYPEMKANVDKVLQFMMEKHIKMHHITSRDIVEGNLKAIMRLILALAAHYKPNSVRHSSSSSQQAASTTSSTTPGAAAYGRQSNLNITGIAQGAAAALTEARRTANKAGHRHRRRRQKEEHHHLHQHQYENQSCSDSDYAYNGPASSQNHHHHHHHQQHLQQQQHHHQHHHHRNSYPSSSSYSKTVKAEHGFSRSSSLMSSSVPTPRHHGGPHSIGLTASQSYQRALGEGEEGGGGVYGRGDLEGASGSSSPVNSVTSPGVSLYMSDPPSSMEPIINSSGALMSASCESDSLTDSGFLEVCHSVKETREMLFNLHTLLLNGEGDENGASSGAPLEGSNSQEKLSVIKERLLNAEEISESLRAELNKTKKDCMELQATKLGLEQRLSEQETELSSTKAELLKRELDTQHVVVEMESLRKQLAEKDQLLSDVKASYVKQEEDKDRVMNELRKEVIKRDQNIEILQDKLSHLDKSSSSVVGSRKNSGTVTSSSAVICNGDRSKETSGIPTTRPGKLDMYVRKTSIAKPKHLSELEAVRDSLRVAKSCSTARCDVTLTLETLEGNIIGLMEKLHTSHGTHTNNPAEHNSSTSGREYPRPWQQSRTGIARGRTSQQAPPSRRAPQQQTDTPASSSSAVPAHKGGSGRTVNGQTAAAKAGRSLIPLPGTRLKTPSPTNAMDTSNNHSNNNQQVVETQVLYYMEENEKPFACSVHKKLGEITLRDFKSLVEESSLYHYFFKAQDPEYGTVKEELFHDDDILPGWEGKIVAWIVEAEGTVC